MQYCSVAELARCVAAWSDSLPRRFEVIVGASPGGMLAARLLALDRPAWVTDLAGLGTDPIVGDRLSSVGGQAWWETAAPRDILVIDDVADEADALEGARQAIARYGLTHRVEYAAVYAGQPALEAGRVQYHARGIAGDWFFDWRPMDTPLLARCCVDIDGVLCRDPSARDNDDGARYRRFIDNVPPLALPRYGIGWLVTSRLEKYRGATEAWLARHNVTCRELIMMPYPDMAARQAARNYTGFKAAAYRSTDAALFIESAPHTAAGIAQQTRRAVFCFDTRELLGPGVSARNPGLSPRCRPRWATGLRALAALPVRVGRRLQRANTRPVVGASR